MCLTDFFFSFLGSMNACTMIGWSYLWGMYLCIFTFSSFYSSFCLPSISKVAYQRLQIPTMHYRTTRHSDLNYVTVTTDVIDQQSNTADVKYIQRNTARSRQCTGHVIFIGRVILTRLL